MLVRSIGNRGYAWLTACLRIDRPGGVRAVRLTQPPPSQSRLTRKHTLTEIGMKKLLICATTTACLVLSASLAQARSAYDGAWDLVFVTQRGTCDATYGFSVNISNGIVTHPNLVRFRGYVARSGAVRASVTVQDRYASGSGRLFGTSGRGTWSGRSGTDRCSGYWTAQRN